MNKEELKSLLRAGRAWEVEAAHYIEQLERELLELKPKKMTEAEYIALGAQRLKEARAKQEEIAQLYKDQGICPDCEGEGEQGGQFTGGAWQCPACNGTGKYNDLPR